MIAWKSRWESANYDSYVTASQHALPWTAWRCLGRTEEILNFPIMKFQQLSMFLTQFRRSVKGVHFDKRNNGYA